MPLLILIRCSAVVTPSTVPLLVKEGRLIQDSRTIRAYFMHLQDNSVLLSGRGMRMLKYLEFLLLVFT